MYETESVKKLMLMTIVFDMCMTNIKLSDQMHSNPTWLTRHGLCAAVENSDKIRKKVDMIIQNPQLSADPAVLQFLDLRF